MKKYLLVSFAVFMLFEHACFSQKADLQKIQITYTQLPQNPLEKNIKTYKLEFVNNTDLSFPEGKSLVEQIKLEGFQYSEGQPDVIISLSIDNYRNSNYIKTIPGGINAPDVYTYVVDAGIDAKLSVLSSDRLYEFYSTDDFGNALVTHKESLRRYPTEADANAAMAEDKSVTTNLKSECVENAVKALNNYLNINYGYEKHSEVLPICTIESKKYDYSDIENAKEKYILAMDGYSKNGLNENNKKHLEECVAIWEKAVNEYDPNDNKSKISSKNVAEIYLNIVMANMWLNNYEKAKKYNSLLQEEKGLLTWKPKVDGMIALFEKGYEQNQLRESGLLKIQKKASDFFVSPYLMSNKHEYRIKYIEHYNEYEPRKLEYRRVFEYGKNGLLTKVYSQQYDAASGSFTGQSDIHEIEYDQTANKMVIHKDNGSKKEVKIFDKNGIAYLSVNSGSNSVDEYDFHYDDQGRWLGYERKPKKDSRQKFTVSYQNGRADHILHSSLFINYRDSSYRSSKYQFYWAEDKITKFDVSHDREKEPRFENIAYSGNLVYDENGNLSKINDGMQTFNYSYDENGNIIELIITSDTTPTHYTYKWEKGSGNAFEYLFDVVMRNRYHFIHPDLY